MTQATQSDDDDDLPPGLDRMRFLAWAVLLFERAWPKVARRWDCSVCCYARPCSICRAGCRLRST